MTTWAGLGLPSPLVTGYRVTRDLGLARTPFPSALPESGQTRTGGVRAYELAWAVNADQLALATAFLEAQGFRWWTLCMSSGASAVPTDHEVRLTSDVNLTTLAPGVYQLAASAEARLAPTACVPVTCDSDLPPADCPA